MSYEIAGARRVDIPNTDHMIPLRQPGAFNDAVLSFLGAVAGG